MVRRDEPLAETWLKRQVVAILLHLLRTNGLMYLGRALEGQEKARSSPPSGGIFGERATDPALLIRMNPISKFLFWRIVRFLTIFFLLQLSSHKITNLFIQTHTRLQHELSKPLPRREFGPGRRPTIS